MLELEIVSDELKNPFLGYTERLKAKKQAVNPVHEIVNVYYELRGWANREKSFYRGGKAYPRLAREAKELYEALGGNLDDSLWAIDRMNYLATKGNFEWTISTCLKHKKI